MLYAICCWLFAGIYNQAPHTTPTLALSFFPLPASGEERYSILLQRYLQEVFEVNVTVRNYAIRAAASDVQADILFRKHMSRLLQSSLVLVDISVNDRPSHRDVKNEAKRVSRFMASNQSQAGADQHYQQQEKVFAEGRKLMKLLLYYLPKTVGIAYFETFVSGGRYEQQ